MNNLEKQIESLIFYKGEEISFKELSKFTDSKTEEVKEVVNKLEEKYSDSGIKIVKTENSVMLTTGEESSKIIEAIEKEEYEKGFSKATLETLTIILYRGPIKRSMIDFIRGVNSQFTLRNLLIRGLIEKEIDPKDERAFLYKPTTDLLRYMNVGDIKELQEYNEINDKVEAFIKSSKEENE
jgi:segregation and condensation protein B